MGSYSMEHLTVFLSALAATVAAMPLAQILGRRMNALDAPDDLSHHHHVFHMVRTGGIAIAAGIFAGSLTAFLLNHQVLHSRNIVAVMAGSGVVLAVGLLDDLHEIKPWVKVVLLLAACLLTALLMPLVTLTGWVRLDFVLTLLVLMGGANAFNLMDGMDGLAAGLAVASSAGLSFLSLALGTPEGVCVKLIVMGAALGFLYFNRHPARIYMGDCGSLLLGFHLAAMGLNVANGRPQGIIPVLLVLSPFVLDTGLAIVRRLLRGSDAFTGDRSHIYDVLHRQWKPVWQVVGAMWTMGLTFSILGLAAVFLPIKWQAALLAGSWLLVILGMVRRGMFGPEPPSNREERLWEREQEPPE